MIRSARPIMVLGERVVDRLAIRIRNEKRVLLSQLRRISIHISAHVLSAAEDVSKTSLTPADNNLTWEPSVGGLERCDEIQHDGCISMCSSVCLAVWHWLNNTRTERAISERGQR